MKTKIKLVLAALIALGLIAPWAEAAETVVMSLDQAVAKALAVSPELKEAQAALLFSEARLDEARSYRLPQIDTLGLVAPVPIARGDYFSSPDPEGEINGLSFFSSIDVYLIQPLFTFGKIDERIKAARHGRKVERAGLELKSAEVALKVKEYYYGLQLALQTEGLLDEIKGLLKSARRQTEKLLAAESEDIDIEIDESALYRLDAMGGQLASLRAELNEGLALASRALAAVTGQPGKLVRPAEKHLRPVKMDLESLAGYQDAAMNRRPEMIQLKEGLAAMDALVNAARADRWPSLVGAAFFSYAWAPDRTDIENPFIRDDFNHLWGGVGLGVQWHLDFGIQEAKIAQAKAERLKVKAKENFAKMNLPLQVAQYYLAVKKAERQMAASGKAYRAARRWLLVASANYDMGVGPIGEVTDAMEKYATQQALYYKAIHDYNVGWARLKKAIGEPAPEVK